MDQCFLLLTGPALELTFAVNDCEHRQMGFGIDQLDRTVFESVGGASAPAVGFQSGFEVSVMPMRRELFLRAECRARTWGP